MGTERKPYREKRHRLPREASIGRVTVMFTLCVINRAPALADPSLVRRLVDQLESATAKHWCTVPIYTFMPDHIHLLMLGLNEDSDTYAAMATFGHEIGMRVGDVKFQKDFYDRIVRWFEGWEKEAWYIACNPVRAGLTEDPLKWPFTGSIGHDIREVLGR
jgi:putative transposase